MYAVFDDVHSLQIDLEFAVGTAMGMTDTTAKYAGFSCNCTVCHNTCVLSIFFQVDSMQEPHADNTVHFVSLCSV